MADKTEETTGRDVAGRFSPGNKFGRGRPPRDIEKQYLRSFADGCTTEDLTAVVRALVVKAKRGDVSAARLLLQFAMPSKELRVELASDYDREEFRVAGQTASQVNESMIAYISKKLYERRAYEASLKAEQN